MKIKQAAALFLCVSAFAFPLFGDDKDNLTNALKNAIPKYTSDGMNVEEVKRLLDAGADPEGFYDRARSFLFQAAASNNVELTRLLLEHGANPNAVRDDGRSPVFYGNEEITKLFISYGARFDVIAEDGDTPLWSNAYDNKSSAILILEWERTHTPDFSARFETRKDYLNSVLAYILSSDFLGDFKDSINKEYTLTERLLEAGADPAALNKKGIPIAYLAVRTSKASQFIIPLLIEHGAPVDAFNKEGQTVLYCAIAKDNLDLANFLLKRGANPNQQCESGETALMKADSKEAMSLLLNSKANPNLQDNKGNTALIKKRKPELINLLLKAGADPSIKDNEGRTVLHYWDYNLLEPVFDDLIARGCQIDEPDQEGYTPLMYNAARSDSGDILFLLEKGANPNCRDLTGKNALHIYLLDIEERYWRKDDVISEQKYTVIAALLEAGTRPADKDNGGDSALATAIRLPKKNANMIPVSDMVQKYANDEEIKIASAEADKRISAKKKQDRRETLSGNIPSTIKALSFPFVIGGMSVLMYNSSNNFMVPVNAALTFVGGGLVLGALIGASTESGLDALGPAFLGCILGGIAGGIIASRPAVRSAFADIPVLYYAPTAISAVIVSVVVFRIWF